MLVPKSKTSPYSPLDSQSAPPGSYTSTALVFNMELLYRLLLWSPEVGLERQGAISFQVLDQPHQ